MRYSVTLNDIFPAKRNKYGNKKIVMDGEKFDSLKEAGRYQELKLLERTGKITDLQRQVSFELIPVQRDYTGKVIEKKCSYIADFVYQEKESIGESHIVVEDVKGKKTEVYKIKKKLMLHVHGIRIKEV